MMDIFTKTGFGNQPPLAGLTVCKNEVRAGEESGASISYDSSSLAPRAHFTWGWWIPGNAENRRAQVTLSTNHIMIYNIPHHTTHTTLNLTGVFQSIQKKIVLRSTGSVSMTGRYF